MRLIDTHCHLDLYPDVLGILGDIEARGVYTIAVTNTPSVFRRCNDMTRGTRFVRTALGLHPELAGVRGRELSMIDELLPLTRYVGEVGLDFVTQDPEERSAQRRVFSSILDRCASAGDKILSVHSRRAASEVLQMIGTDYPGTVILHWFSGSLAVLDQAVERGCYFSVNTAMLSGAAGRRIASRLPPGRVLTETDGPFVTVRNRPAIATDIGDVLAVLARLWSLDALSAARQVQHNFRSALSARREPSSSPAAEHLE